MAATEVVPEVGQVTVVGQPKIQEPSRVADDEIL
jgi:hypothetical protein